MHASQRVCLHVFVWAFMGNVRVGAELQASVVCVKSARTFHLVLCVMRARARAKCDKAYAKRIAAEARAVFLEVGARGVL